MNNSIDIQIDSRLKKNDRFVIFRLPDTSTCTLVDLSPPASLDYSFFENPRFTEGFVAAPFDDTETSGWWFKPFDLLTMQLRKPIVPLAVNPSKNLTAHNAGFEGYSKQFSVMMDALKNEELQKVILSRQIKYNLNLQNDLSNLFQQLCHQHPTAFVYLLSTPETGIWAGASPELLLKKQQSALTTVALAGTRQLNDFDPAQWNQKELVEQGFVSNYIDRLLDRFKIGNYQKSGPAITRAGSVTHLKTSYQFNYQSIKGQLGAFIKALHPTPALGGEPKEVAMALIRKVEEHSRQLYGGFLGMVTEHDLNLFVNIRCMKIEAEHIKIFAGGGLTADSQLQQEWDETILKCQTLLSVINNL